MKVNYTPEDGDPQEWDWNPDRVRTGEAEQIEKRYGKSYQSFVMDVQSGNVKAMHVLLWHLLRKEHKTLRYEDTPDFYVSELTVEHTMSELEALRERAMKAAGLNDEEREELISVLDSEIANRGDDPK